MLDEATVVDFRTTPPDLLLMSATPPFTNAVRNIA